jgi:hypothetical protein
LAGDSGPDASGSGSFPDGQVFGGKSFTFDLGTSTLPTGDLNLRLAFDGTGDAFYQVTVTTRSASSISEPSGLLPFAAGAASLGFLAARRRRRKATPAQEIVARTTCSYDGAIGRKPRSNLY